MHGSVLSNLAQQDKIVLGAWVLVSTGLLFYAIAFALRGLGFNPGQRRV